MPVLFWQNRCSAWETTPGPLSIRSTFGGPPATVNAVSSSLTRRSAVIDRSTMFISDSRVCSSIIEAILMALPSVVESNWKSIAHTTFGASASIGGIEAPPAPLAWRADLDLHALFVPQPVHLLLIDLLVFVITQRRPRAAKPVAGMLGGVGTQPRSHLGVRISVVSAGGSRR